MPTVADQLGDMIDVSQYSTSTSFQREIDHLAEHHSCSGNLCESNMLLRVIFQQCVKDSRCQSEGGIRSAPLRWALGFFWTAEQVPHRLEPSRPDMGDEVVGASSICPC